MYTRDPAWHAAAELRPWPIARLETIRLVLENLVEFAVWNLPNHFAVANQSIANGDINQLGRPQSHGHLAARSSELTR
ncbi:MAG: hypothetical protein CM1200mP29_10860 [Verrucomicrobiota bacterium]|nr:MAG: hypothetical protein CM1200mP29_10860 [Verrucomicrobiota bacterium]